MNPSRTNANVITSSPTIEPNLLGSLSSALALSSSLPNASHGFPHRRKHHSVNKRGRHHNPLSSSPSKAATAAHKMMQHQQEMQHSTSIPLPKSHIHRTPSELQLADDTRRAEFEDVRMYARLVVGMQSQCVDRGYVHPLTKKSLQDILKTKQDDQDDLEEEGSAAHEVQCEDDDWGLSYDPAYDHQDNQDRDSSLLRNSLVREDPLSRGGSVSPLPCHPLGLGVAAPTVVKTPSHGSIVSNFSQQEEEEDDDDDEGVFSLEL